MKLHTHGFTLIELMVSVALFSIVMVLVAGSYLRLVAIDHALQSTNNAVNNLSFAVDSMQRSIRTGDNYSLTASGGSSSFTFEDEASQCVTYQLNTATNGNGQIDECINTISPPCTTSPPLCTVALTDPAINIKTLQFTSNNVSKGSSVQPQVSFLIVGVTAPGPGTPIASTTFTIEGAATQRNINL